MSAVETVQQVNMFTGELEAKRTYNPRLQQMPMFSLNETFEFGARVRPYLAEGPRPTLELIREDLRTPEEIERDRERQAQTLTSSLFAVEVVLPAASPAFPDETVRVQSATPDDADDEEEENTPLLKPPAEALSQFAAYVELVRLAEEEAITLEHSLESKQAALACLSLAQFEAKRAGMTDYEITTALMIGEFRGKARVRAARPVTAAPVVPLTSDKPENPAAALLTPAAPETIERTREEEDLPILWLKRSDLLRRRPDLAASIQTLNDDELAFIAERVGDALEEFYWIQLNVVLSLYLDHELQLRLKVPKRAS